MVFAKIFQVTGWQATLLSIVARVVDDAAVPYQRSNVSSIAWNVYAPGGTLSESGSLVKNDVLFNDLQVDARWNKDSIGYNFAGDIPGSAFPDPGLYRVEIIFTLTDSQEIPVVIQADMLRVRSFS